MIFRALLCAGAVAACGDNLSLAPGADGSPDAAADAAVDAPPDAAPDAAPPLSVFSTGGYDPVTLEPAAGLFEYSPRFELWSDGASKRRWIQLPAGQTIDSSDMDFWVYPIGTRIWKEFSFAGMRIETRMIEKQGPNLRDWQPFTFAWNDDESDALEVIDGVTDARGTTQDIPSRFACGTCHETQPDYVLGFSAIQLDGAGRGYGVTGLIGDGVLSDPPVGSPPTWFPLPGNAVDQAGLGYLHGNCGGCHHSESPVFDNIVVELRIMVDNLATVADTRAFQTAVGVTPQQNVDGATSIIEPGMPEASAVHIRMSSTNPNVRMPPLATTVVDPDGTADVGAWINSL